MKLITSPFLLILYIQIQQTSLAAPTAQSTNLSEHQHSLLKMLDRKPVRLDIGEGKKYVEEFQSHPLIQGINLDTPHHEEAVKQLMTLSAEIKDSKQMHKMHAMINRHLRDKNADSRLIALYFGQRHQTTKRKLSNVGKQLKRKQDPDYFRRKARESRERIKAAALGRAHVPEIIDLFGETVLDANMTTIQIAEMARQFRGRYESEHSYTWALKRYLKKLKFDNKEIDAATGWTALQIKNAKRRKQGRPQGPLGAGLSHRDMQWLPDLLNDTPKENTQRETYVDKQGLSTPSWSKVPRKARSAEIHYPVKADQPQDHIVDKAMPKDWWKMHNL